MQVSKWGDSLGVRLPKELVEEMGLAVGDELNVVDVKGKTIVVEKDLRKQQALESLAAMKVKLRPPTTNSIAAKPTTGEGILRHEHFDLRDDGRRSRLSCPRAVARWRRGQHASSQRILSGRTQEIEARLDIG
jgi:antitoxin MazE